MSENYYEHTDGGLYRFVAYARSADTDSEVVVYEHLWPFNQSLWVRDRKQFEARFKPTSKEAVDAAVKSDQASAQAKVRAAKAARRSAKGQL